MTKACWEKTVDNIDAKEQPHFPHLFSIYLLASVAESFNVTIFMPRRV